MGRDFYDYAYSAPSVLQDGMFAAPFEEWDDVKENLNKNFAASAINPVWGKDQVFIAKGTRTINGEKLGDFKIRGHDLVNDARVCDDGEDGDGTCYFFVMAQSFRKSAAALGEGGGIKNPRGLDKLDEFGLDKLQFAKSADWYQNTFGAYLKNATASDMYNALKNIDTSSNYFVNMPVVSFDNAPGIDPHNPGSLGNVYHTEDYFLEELSRYVQPDTLDGWPYASMWD